MGDLVVKGEGRGSSGLGDQGLERRRDGKSCTEGYQSSSHGVTGKVGAAVRARGVLHVHVIIVVIRL